MKKILRMFVIGAMVATMAFTCNIGKAMAATGTITISSSSSVVVGNTVSVTVTLSGSKIFYWQLYVTYDTSKLKLVSGSTTMQGEADDATNGTSSVSQTLKFKATNTGNANINVSMGQSDMNIDANFNAITYAKKTKTISVVPVTPKSTNNNLASLSIDNATLDPTFSAGVTSYNVELPPETATIKVNAAAADGKASISGAGNVNVVEGNNTINVVVTAESGATKTYVINAIVKEYDPIEVKVSGETFTVVRKKSLLTAPTNYTETTATISNQQVPAYTSTITKFTLVGLKDSKGNIGYYIYDSKNQTYTLYRELSFNKIVLYPMTINKKDIPNGYHEATITYNDIKVTAYKIDAGSNFALLYGMNVGTGKMSLYVYDNAENTLQRYNNEEIQQLNHTINTYLIAIIVLSVMVLAAIITAIVILIKRLKKGKNIPKFKSHKVVLEE